MYLDIILMTIAFLLFIGTVCLLLNAGLQKDTLEYDLTFLWNHYPEEIIHDIRVSFPEKQFG